MGYRPGKRYMAASSQMRMQNLIAELGELLGDSKAAEALSAKLFGMEAHELEGLQDSLEVLLQAADEPLGPTGEMHSAQFAFRPTFGENRMTEASGHY